MLDRPTGSATATPAPIRGAFARRRPPGAARARSAQPAPRCSRRCAATALALLANVVLWPLFAFVAIKQVTPRYTAVGTLIYEPSEYKVRELQSVLQADPTTEAVMASQAEILRGLRVVQARRRARQPVQRSGIQPCAASARPPAPAIEAVVAWFAPGTAPPPSGRPWPVRTHDIGRNATLLAVQRHSMRTR